MRICIYTKRLNQHLDEGIANVAYEIGTKLLAKEHNVLILFSAGDAIERDNIVKIPLNPLFISPRLMAELRKFRPHVIIYIPRASANLLNFWRARVLKWYGNDTKVVMLVLQPNAFNFLSKRIAPWLQPDLILAASNKTANELANLGCQAKFSPLGVDCWKFTPVNIERKRELRRKYGLDPASFIILHTGHINITRNIGLLKTIQSNKNQVLILGSTSTHQDSVLREELQAGGIKVFTNYLDNVEEVYQLCDCYVFPTVSGTASINIPLSVLEAMACNLSVISTRFGGLIDLFPEERGGLFYAEDMAGFVAKVRYLRENAGTVSVKTREMVQAYSWQKWGEEFSKILRTLVA